MAKPTNETKKALAIAALLGATLNSSMNGDFKLSFLKKQCDSAMGVFASKNRKVYYTTCDQTFEIWKALADKHSNTLDTDEVALFTEMLCSLIPRHHFKLFFNMNPYTTIEKIRDSRKSAILMSVLTLDESLNKMFGTEATSTRETLGLILSKPIKIKKVKTVKRDNAVPARIKKLRKRIKWVKRRVK